MKDHTASDSKSPSIDIYLQRNLKNNQAIILNTVGTYIHTYDDRTYEEKKHSILATDIYSAIRGKKYSFIGEGIYRKEIHQQQAQCRYPPPAITDGEQVRRHFFGGNADAGSTHFHLYRIQQQNKKV